MPHDLSWFEDWTPYPLTLGTSASYKEHMDQLEHFSDHFLEESKPYREFREACLQSPTCQNPAVLKKQSSCVKMCMSPSCYVRVYKMWDPLEPGEIDFKLSQFILCFNQRFYKKDWKY
eukprot:TCALIF_04367-PA protein Name:"Protein of unknown function" AED:0.21 eAED:0.26 QI:0/-1/0/1/-1/1/1/0/117